eukprot:4468778-Pleurochrysis_carterae.AAC.1
MLDVIRASADCIGARASALRVPSHRRGRAHVWKQLQVQHSRILDASNVQNRSTLALRHRDIALGRRSAVLLKPKDNSAPIWPFGKRAGIRM